ncbi:MAG: thymidine phosphorylase [Candidatus Eremiobacteraeota bacterium]|nr:thymidine phosphorylase [Candidatus Eremiobacteraeota bacterium]
MNLFEVRRAIERKRDGEALADATIEALIAGYVAGRIDEAQIAAFLMACVLRGLDEHETETLTRAMIASGETVDLGLDAVDKHSTGGVGDTVSLIVVPLVAACGVPVAKLSGRALGHTGGTLDKLEAIPGLSTEMTIERFRALVREIGCAISSQSERLVPADKKLYALRDRTGTIPERGLIASSIVSKKIAAGARWIVYDVKCGRGSFLRTESEARALAGSFVRLTESFGRGAIAHLTDMEEPLGPAIGSGVEAIEARDFLRGTRRDRRLEAGIRHVGEAMLEIAGAPKERLQRALDDGSAYEKFVALVEAQGGSRSALEEMTPLPARLATAAQSGFVDSLDTVALGELGHDLVASEGAFAGVRLAVKLGDAVAQGEIVAELYGGDDAAEARLHAAVSIGAVQPRSRTLVIESIGSSSPSRITSAIR